MDFRLSLLLRLLMFTRRMGRRTVSTRGKKKKKNNNNRVVPFISSPEGNPFTPNLNGNFGWGVVFVLLQGGQCHTHHELPQRSRQPSYIAFDSTLLNPVSPHRHRSRKGGGGGGEVTPAAPCCTFVDMSRAAYLYLAEIGTSGAQLYWQLLANGSYASTEPTYPTEFTDPGCQGSIVNTDNGTLFTSNAGSTTARVGV